MKESWYLYIYDNGNERWWGGGSYWHDDDDDDDYDDDYDDDNKWRYDEVMCMRQKP